MKDLTELNAYRRHSPFHGWEGDKTCGLFELPSPRTAATLRCIASTGDGWDHVSVSLPNRCPNWIEMEHVKRAFFKDDETAMQLHVPASDHINAHPYCLHLWRPNDGRNIPRPPPELIA